jgi:hypothetical protein
VNKRLKRPTNRLTRTVDKQRENSGPVRRGLFGKGNPYAWQPGQSGNRAGRPKHRTLSEAFRSKLAEIDPDDPAARTFAEVIAERLVQAAAGRVGSESSIVAARELADRTEGKARQAVEFDTKLEAQQLLAALLGCAADELPDRMT